jgi:hypothetical protein
VLRTQVLCLSESRLAELAEFTVDTSTAVVTSEGKCRHGLLSSRLGIRMAAVLSMLAGVMEF